METSRNERMTRQGTVVSAGKMDKTVVVLIVSRVKSPIYKKVVKKSKKFKAHDEKNECRVGDVVKIMETGTVTAITTISGLDIRHMNIKEPKTVYMLVMI